MTFLAPRGAMPPITGISYCWRPASGLDRDIVADAIRGTAWSVRYHEAPDYEVSLMILPDDDERFSAFVISAAGSRFRLQVCQDDALQDLGAFDTLEAAITALSRALSDQTSLTVRGG